MADLLAELENMAANAVINELDSQFEDSSLSRWQTLFGLSFEQASARIRQHRLDISRRRITDELWESIRSEKEAEGFDRESYEYSLQQIVDSSAATLAQLSKRSSEAFRHSGEPTPNTSYILKLDGPLSLAETVQKAAQLSCIPEIVHGVGLESDATVSFCKIDAPAREKILGWIDKQHPTYRPTIVRLSASPKDLSASTMAPFIGVDTILPQHRLAEDCIPLPAQDQYPVWYLFYGNLAKSDELQRRLGLAEPPIYKPAQIEGAVMKSWRGEYRALIDGTSCSQKVDGSAYLVESKEHEDILRFYETDKYEVVRCRIFMGDTQKSVVDGLVFRFAGSGAELI